MVKDKVSTLPVTPGGRYPSSMGLTAVTNITTEADSSEYLAVDVEGVGMGGASLVRQQAIEWDTYVSLNEPLREAACAKTSVVIEPPGDWKLALRAALGAIVDPTGVTAPGMLYHEHRDELWRLEPYHSVAEDARYPKNIDDEVLDNLDSVVEYNPVEPGRFYLEHGEAHVYAGLSFGAEQSATDLDVMGVRPRVIDVDDVQLVPQEELASLSGEEIRELETTDGLWLQHSAAHMNDFFESVRLVQEASVRPESLAVRLALLREWADFHRGFGDFGGIEEILRDRFADTVDSGLEWAVDFSRRHDL